jgi:predicted nucleotidyltransferase
MGIRIEVPKEKIATFCRRNHIRSFAFFGSVLRDDFRPESDVDVLVQFDPGQEPDLMEIVAMENELSEILGHKVDLVERQAVEESENYIRRRHILQSEEAIDVA